MQIDEIQVLTLPPKGDLACSERLKIRIAISFERNIPDLKEGWGWTCAYNKCN
jgi:hypothetical protein